MQASELKELRNKVAAGFIFANFTFAIVTIIAQSNAKDVYVPWPCPAKEQPGKENLARIDDNFSKVDLSGIIFLVVFGACLVVQFIAMFIHRLGTFMHLMSTTELFPKKSPEFTTDPKDMVGLAQALGDLAQDTDDDDEPDYEDEEYDGISAATGTFKKTGFEKLRNQRREQIKTYSQAVIKRLQQLQKAKDGHLPKDKGFIAATKNATTKKALMTVRRNLNTMRLGKNNINYGFENISVRNSGHPRRPNQPPLGRNALAVKDSPRNGRFVQHKRLGKTRGPDFSRESIMSNETSDRQFPF